MDIEYLNTICHNISEMRLLVEGGIALFEDEWDADPQETGDLMGEALYMLRVRLQQCQKAFRDSARQTIKGE